ncbi:MAG: magnesium transporter [Candidatus Nanopelagicales bacterium]
MSAGTETISGRATTRVPICEPGESAATVRARVVGTSFDTVADLPVLTDGEVRGLVSVEALLAAADDTAMSAIMDRDPPTVAPGVDQEVAAWTMLQHGESSLLVVDGQGRFCGIVPPQRILSVLLAEHEEDLSRIAGVVHDTESVRDRTLESVPHRVLHRLPWLLVGLVGAMVAAMIVSSFDEAISAQVVLAFFLPGVVYMADAVGTQTETVVVRGLSVGVPVARVARREVWTGLIIGTFVAILFVPMGWLVFGDLGLMLAVGLSLFVSCAVASVVAMALPYILSRMGRDPAYGSGPLATVVQDLLTIVCYGVIVTHLVV